MKKIILLIVFISITITTFAQSTWKRKEVTAPPLQIFASNEVFDLPTTELPGKGDYYFSISHKFLTPVSNGAKDLFGLDGSAIMKISIGYSVSEDLFLKLSRSNYEGNYDLSMKYKVKELKNDFLPVVLTVIGGVAYNSKALNEPSEKGRLFQYYAQGIINTKFIDKLCFGLVPSVLINSRIDRMESINSFTLGAYLQYYLDRNWSIFVESNNTYNGWRYKYDSYNAGIELNTGGHFFKLLLSNNSFLANSQYLSGALDTFESGNLHLAFIISRTL